jgi:PAP2 superfamily protein
VKFARIARPYFFEIFTVVNFIILFLAYPAIMRASAAMFPVMFVSFVLCFVMQVLVGMAVRIGFAHRRGTMPDLLTIYRSGDWIADTIRLIVFSALSGYAYCWIKLATPILHRTLYDQQLWNLDRAIGFGYAPTVFILTLFSSPGFVHIIDETYATVLVPAFSIIPAFFLSVPERRVRVTFMNSNSLLWLVGAWLYVAIPALGPAYAFPEVWLPLAPMLEKTQLLQRLLMANYRATIAISRAANAEPINLFFGVAAFPSLHVGFQVLAFLWMRRLTRWGTLFGVLAVFTFIGSVITGWHYVVDGIAGGLLAWASYAAAQRVPAIRG